MLYVASTIPVFSTVKVFDKFHPGSIFSPLSSCPFVYIIDNVPVSTTSDEAVSFPIIILVKNAYEGLTILSTISIESITVTV